MIHYYIIAILAISLIPFKYIGIWKNYKNNKYTLMYPLAMLRFYIILVLIYLVEIFLQKIDNIGRIYVFGFYYLVLFFDVRMTICIMQGKFKLNYASKINNKYTTIASFEPLQKQNDNWTEEGTANTGPIVSESNYNELEKKLRFDIKTNSDFIDKNKENDDWD